ncbi:tigger transposable element-derived protein 1 [Nephila pilipes]|uniref:Tigger transposable element-derived protein 1 n=1 Tax=Nephila pilipes TaxID=299642 RepID=A0A8X6N6Q5_NEPPI|nr:tigger transposable element-derived protein 1 [Nephila pilipes]
MLLCLVVETRVHCMAATTCHSLCLCLFFVKFWIVYMLCSAYFVILTIHPKVKEKTGEKKKPKKMISMEEKHEFIAKHERGVRMMANEYGRNPSTISTIIKQKEAIKKLQPSKGVTIISKQRTNIHDEMEQLLLLRIKEKQLAGDSVSKAILCEKAGAIFQDFMRDVTETEGESCKAVRGSKQIVAGLTILRNEVKFIQFFVMENHLVEILRWLKISSRCTFITAEDKSLPGHKAMKDRLTPALCANAIGDFKKKPLLVYHSESPRAFKAYKVMKEKLQVLWRSNSKAWVTRQYFIESMHIFFRPSVQK